VRAARQLDPESPLSVLVLMEEIALQDRDCLICREKYESSHEDQEAEHLLGSSVVTYLVIYA
jgi:hypothetical protein